MASMASMVCRHSGGLTWKSPWCLVAATGVEWRRMAASMGDWSADTEGADVEVPLCPPVVRETCTVVVWFIFRTVGRFAVLLVLVVERILRQLLKSLFGRSILLVSPFAVVEILFL